MGTDEELGKRDRIRLKKPWKRHGQVPYVINEGDGAFYGPKLDFHLEDCHRQNMAVRYDPAGYADAAAL